MDHGPGGERSRAASLLRAGLVLLLLLLGRPGTAAGGATTLTILHVNDFHGWLLPHRPAAGLPEEGGAARLAALVRRERTPTTLFLAAGDLMQGTSLSNLFDGRPVIEALSQMGLDASAVGNHEFDIGLAALRARAAEASFPFLAANIAGAEIWRPSLVRTVGPLRVALFGLTTEETPVTTHPRNVPGLTFLPAVETARRQVAQLRPRADLVVLLSHLGFEEDERLAAAVPGIDVIVGGHTHTRVEQPVRVGGTLILQAFERGAVLGRLDLTVEDGRVTGSAYRLIPVAADAGEDAAVTAIVERYRRRLDERLHEAVGTATAALDGDHDRLRSRETALGNLVADAVRAAAGADVALLNGGAIRAGVPAGAVTLGALYDALPFDSWVISFALTGGELRQALETGVSRLPARDGRFPQVSGLSFVLDPRRPAGSRVGAVTVGGAPLDEGRRYVVATNDFLAAGGDGYTVFTGREPIYNDASRYLRDVLADWWRRAGTITPAVEGRIKEAP